VALAVEVRVLSPASVVVVGFVATFGTPADRTSLEPNSERTRPMIVRTLALLAAIAGLAAGCSLGSAASHTAPPGIVAPPLSHYRGNGIAFSYPAAWGHHRHGFYSMETDGIIDLSTQRMVDPCRPAGNGHTCGWPLHTLHPGGVVVTWTTGGDIDPAALPTAGTTVKVTRPGDCRSIGGGETLLARLVTSRRSVFSVAACLRAPGLAANQREFRAMLASARALPGRGLAARSAPTRHS
jgi:hypothetical protein